MGPVDELLGEREEKRAGEELATKVLKPLSAVFIGPLERYKPIEAETVARAMLAAAKAEKPGKHIHPSNQIARLGS